MKPEVCKLTFINVPSDHDGVGCLDTPQMDTQFNVVVYDTIISPKLPALHNKQQICLLCNAGAVYFDKKWNMKNVVQKNDRFQKL